jgi:hypothetical protein
VFRFRMSLDRLGCFWTLDVRLLFGSPKPSSDNECQLGDGSDPLRGFTASRFWPPRSYRKAQTPAMGRPSEKAMPIYFTRVYEIRRVLPNGTDACHRVFQA